MNPTPLGPAMWNQVYDPFANQPLSTQVAAIPLEMLLASGTVKAQRAALTGSDTASGGLFGGIQKITARQPGVSPIRIGAHLPRAA